MISGNKNILQKNIPAIAAGTVEKTYLEEDNETIPVDRNFEEEAFKRMAEYSMEHRGNGYYGNSMSNNAVAAYSEGKRPISKITKKDLMDYGIENVSVDLAKWVLKCSIDSCEYHHTGLYANMTDFYDLKDLKRFLDSHNLEDLKHKYNEYREKKKIEKADSKIEDENYCFAEVEYTERRGDRKHYKNHRFREFAVIYKGTAHITLEKRKKTNGGKFNIIEKFDERPEGMEATLADAILKKLNLQA
jgi:hypothetical protein